MPEMFHCGIGLYLNSPMLAPQSEHFLSSAISSCRHTVANIGHKSYSKSFAVYSACATQNGQMSANDTPSSMSADISCLPVSTGGDKNFRPQFLHLTDFCYTSCLILLLLTDVIWNIM